MKKLCVVIAALILILSLAAFGKQQPAPTPTPEASPAYALRFSTTDRDGETVDETILAGHKLIVLNFWEPWCPPCVAEMPALEKLYQDYQDKGLLILGIYSTQGQEDSVDRVLENSQTSYPILHYTDAFDGFMTGYVPTTVFLDSEGNTVSELLVGGRDYDAWEALILEHLQ